MKKTILFIENKLRIDKIGFLYLAAILKDAGHLVVMIQDSVDDADRYLSDNHVDFVMYSVMTGEHLWFLEKNKELKSKHSFKSVVGGPHFTFFPEQGIEDPNIDYIVQGPGENIILGIVSGKYTEKCIKGSMPNVNSLLPPDRSILYKYEEFGSSKMKRFITARYCLYSCKYCFNHLYKRLYKDELYLLNQRITPDKIISEILDVKEKYGLETVYFNDDDFPGDPEWLSEFCTKYKERVNLPYCGSMRANSVTRDSIKMLAYSGCTFMNIALESANPETQVFLRRGRITNQQVEEACNACKEFGIKVRLQNMIGLPVNDPLKDALDTLIYNIKINPTDSWSAVFQPFPKTDLWEESLKKGLITEQTQAVNFYEGTQLMIKDAEQINRLHKWWFFAIKYQLPIELVKILLTIPITKEQEKQIQDLRWNIAKELLYGL